MYRPQHQGVQVRQMHSPEGALRLVTAIMEYKLQNLQPVAASQDCKDFCRPVVQEETDVRKVRYRGLGASNAIGSGHQRTAHK